jgi:hypothetical protein
MGGPGNKRIAARAMDTHFVISGMNSRLHGFRPWVVQTSIRTLRFYRNAPGFSNPERASAALKSGTGTTLSQRIAGCR